LVVYLKVRGGWAAQSDSAAHENGAGRARGARDRLGYREAPAVPAR
jgi:hypothetical protein